MKNGITRILILCALINLAFAGFTYSQEICDNGIDDDGDGLIDLQDDDCQCSGFLSQDTSIIPNPSFEKSSNCPDTFSQMNLVTNWDNASSTIASTTDYIHTCGFMTGGYITPPTPFPDGEACIGLVSYNRNSTIHEYVGTCLPGDPLEKDSSYTLNFYVGFGIQTIVDDDHNLDSVYSESPAYFTLYGNRDCSQFPFPASTCPTDFPASRWEPIDTIEVRGYQEWVETEFKFKPNMDYQSIVLGPPCGSKPLGNEVQYHFIDNLILSKTENFTVKAPTLNGSVCDSTLELSSPRVDAGLNYQWYRNGVAISGANSLNLPLGSGNVAGNYQVRISKGSDCVVSLPVEVSSDPSNLLEVNGPTVICENSTATLTATAGFSNYRWSNNDTTNSIDITTGGTYQLTVTDDNGCTQETSFEVTGPVEISLNATITNAQSTNDNGSISLNPSGGSPEYTYNWSNGSDSGTISGLSSGTYTVTVEDDNGCTKVDSFVVNFIPDDLEANIKVKNLDCYDDSSGRITLDIKGGVPELTVLWNTGSPELEIDSLSAGTYSVTITDAEGDRLILNTTVEQPDPLQVDKVELQSPSCYGFSDGQINTSITGGTLDYQISWNGNGGAGEDLTDIPAGSYELMVIDDHGCELTENFELTQPDPLEMDWEKKSPTCFGYEDGRIRINQLKGGTGDYTLTLNGNTISSYGEDNLVAGSYLLQVEDENSCRHEENILLETPPLITVKANADQNKIMKGGKVQLSGFIDPDNLDNYSLQWEASTSEPQFENDRELETGARPKSSTTFTLTLDRNGCTYADEVFVEVSPTTFYTPNAFSPNGDGINDVFNFASNFEEGLHIKEFAIFDRWGSMVYSAQNIDLDQFEGWDGSGKNGTMKAGVYVYRITLENGRGEIFRYAGDVFLKR